jgi:DNA-binding transcriptional MerR regulator
MNNTLTSQSSPEEGKKEDSVRSQERTQETTSRPKKAPSAFRTISEVADDLGVQQHVLRFWETKFTQVKPLKRGGGRRYYRPEDVELLKRIHHLLYTEGYTIKGVQKLLKGQGKSQIIAGDIKPPANESKPAEKEVAVSAKGENALNDKQRVILQAMLGDLKDLRDMLRGDESES